MPATELDQIVNLCKRRGFVYQSAEIYGGFRSTYDYGPLGALMLRNVKEAWIRTMVQQRDDVVMIHAAVLGPPQVWEASGHLSNFTDPLVDCTNCKQRFREDHTGPGRDFVQRVPDLRQEVGRVRSQQQKSVGSPVAPHRVP